MKIYRTIKDISDHISEIKQTGKKVGFVPTMGALHAGHISLVDYCIKNDAYCVVSIFVNPTQFNNASDLEHYPRTWEEDLAMLEGKADAIFAPTVKEMYPEPDMREFDFGTIGSVMEGEHRPGHFNGVAQIVSKLFDAVQPDVSYFGDKDFQQVAIVKAMVKQLNYPVEIVPCPIMREADGLAMSSRNMRLSEDLRSKAPIIYKALTESKANASANTIQKTIENVLKSINSVKPLEVEYFQIVNEDSLQAADHWDEPGNKVGCVAVFAGDIRLIDNIRY